MDWKKFLFGVVPSDVKGLKKALLHARLLFWICIVAFVFVFYGTMQMNEEINSCWNELQPYRLSNSANSFVGGFPSDDCSIDDGYVVCNIDNFSVIT